MHAMANMALRAARRAGQVLLQGMDRLDRIEVEQKAPDDFVSSIDRQAEDAIVELLGSAYPKHAILGEERGAVGEADAECTWIVDPLDGTFNYLRGIPHFAVSIAARRGRHIEHGVILDPVRNEEWVASRGSGAWLNGRRVRVGSARRLREALLATGIAPRARSRLAPYLQSLQDLSERCRGIRRQGSAALDLAYTASGRVDGFWELGLAPWDIAAGALLIRESGGFVGDLRGGDSWLETGDILAANPACFKAMAARLRCHF